MDPKKILLVDDDPDQRLTMRLPLEAAGYAVFEAVSLTEGLDKVKEVKPDLIILDVMMDTMTSGFQFALEVHSQNPNSEYRQFKDVPILMLTAIHSTTPLRFGADEDYLPVDEFLDKPVDPEVLLAKVRQRLG